MNICIIGDGLTSLSLAKNLINKKINVHIYLEKHFKVDEFLRKIGFQNQQSFLKFFKKEIGTSPAVYRKKFQVPSESVNHSNLIKV